MQLTDLECAKFAKVFNAPSVAYIETLSPEEFAKFIFYLYERDGLYRPVYVDGPGDGGVDIELRSRDGALPELQGVVQCKRYTDHKVTGNEMIIFAAAARHARVRRRSYFTLQGFVPAAFREARQAEIVTFDTLGIRNWILDIQRRERNVARLTPDLPSPDQFPVPIICVSNDKGGVGKTTITGNVAAALATDERGALVIDADPAGYLSYWLTNEERIEPDVSLHAVLTKHYPIYALIRKTLEPNLWLLPSSRALGSLPGGLDAFSLERQLAYALAELPLFDPPIGYILIDTPPGPSFLTRVALVAAQYLVMPLQLDTLSYTGLKGLLKFVADTESVHKPHPIRVLGGIGTMVDARVRLAKRFEREIPTEAARQPRLRGTDLTPDRFWIGKLRDRAEFPRAVFEHQTVLSLDNGSDASKDVRQIAQEVAKRVHILAPQRID